jgi:hypothetical protein
MPRLVCAMAYRSNASASNHVHPTSLDGFLAVRCRNPLKGVLPNSALLVSVGRSSHWNARGGRCRLTLALAFMNSKTVMVGNVFYHQIDCGHLNRLETSPKLVQELRVTNVDCPKEQHNHKHEGW